MRNSHPLNALFPRSRKLILSALFTRPQKWWYLSELAEHLRTRPSSLQREVAALAEGGILERRREGTRAYYRADARSPLFPELRRLFEKTAGLIPVLQEFLEGFDGRIQFAFVYGSVARGKETAASDVDLLVVGSAGLADLAPALRKAESRLGREIHATSYSLKEFQKQAAHKDHFLSAVLRGPKTFVKGSQSDLEEIIG